MKTPARRRIERPLRSPAGLACLGFAAAFSASIGTARAGGDADSLASSVMSQDSARGWADTTFAFDVVGKDRFLLRHAFSLDHYLESQHNWLLVREGPIGVDAFVSRYGVGRGRALVTLDGVPFNDPQDGRAPLAHVPTSAVGKLSFTPAQPGYANAAEGWIGITTPHAPSSRPTTFFELSKGTNALRQRRARFSSIEGPIGVDLAYDEILNDGYYLPGVSVVSPLGTSSRHVSLNLRGTLESGERYGFSLRRFEGSTRGPGFSPNDLHRRGGQIAALSAGVGKTDLTVYGRGHDLFTPDSSTASQTNGARLEWRAVETDHFDLTVGAGAEDVDARQTIGGAFSRRRVTTAVGELVARGDVAARTRATATASFGGYTRHARAYGFGVDVTRDFEFARVGAGVRRQFRLPTIGELFLPEHDRDGLTLAGNSDLDAEVSYEADLHARVAAGALANQVAVTTMSVENPIAFRKPGGIVSSTSRTALEGDRETITFVEERLFADAVFRDVSLSLSAGVVYASGDRDGFFASVPEVRTTAELRVGSTLFEATSALYGSAEWVHTSERRDFTNSSLPAYDVLNLKLDGRLLDAHMYLVWFNVLAEEYLTEGNYFMTPRTFVYGIVWTLFE